MLAGIRGGVVWRRGGDGSALKSGFLIEWLLFAFFFSPAGEGRGDVSAAALFLRT